MGSEFKNYVGTKIITAKPSNLLEYKKIKHGIAATIHHSDALIEGYIVEYPGIGENKEVYISWSPKAVFEKAYREITEEELKLITLG